MNATLIDELHFVTFTTRMPFPNGINLQVLFHECLSVCEFKLFFCQISNSLFIACLRSYNCISTYIHILLVTLMLAS